MLTAQLDAHGSLQIEEETPENGGPRRKPRFSSRKGASKLADLRCFAWKRGREEGEGKNASRASNGAGERGRERLGTQDERERWEKILNASVQKDLRERHCRWERICVSLPRILRILLQASVRLPQQNQTELNASKCLSLKSPIVSIVPHMFSKVTLWSHRMAYTEHVFKCFSKYQGARDFWTWKSIRFCSSRSQRCDGVRSLLSKLPQRLQIRLSENLDSRDSKYVAELGEGHGRPPGTGAGCTARSLLLRRSEAAPMPSTRGSQAPPFFPFPAIPPRKSGHRYRYVLAKVRSDGVRFRTCEDTLISTP